MFFDGLFSAQVYAKLTIIHPSIAAGRRRFPYVCNFNLFTQGSSFAEWSSTVPSIWARPCNTQALFIVAAHKSNLDDSPTSAAYRDWVRNTGIKTRCATARTKIWATWKRTNIPTAVPQGLKNLSRCIFKHKLLSHIRKLSVEITD